MKKLILLYSLTFGLISIIFASGVYFAFFEKTKEKQKEVKETQVENKMPADAIVISYIKKKQVCKFSTLIRKLKENPNFFSRVRVDLSHGSESIFMEKPPATIDQLLKWETFDFIVLNFPDGFLDDQPGILAINCDNYDKKNPDFLVGVNTERKTSYGSSGKSIPYFTAKTGKESVSEVEEQKYILEAIEYAIYNIQ